MNSKAITPITEQNPITTIEEQLLFDPDLQSKHTRRGYLADLKQFEQWREGRPVTKLLVEEYATILLNQGKSPATINRRLSAVRWWLRRVADMAMEDHTMTRSKRHDLSEQASRAASVDSVRGSTEQKGRHILQGELKALMATCAADPTPAGRRDAAMIAMAWATGMRQQELAGLELSDYKPNGEGDADLLVHGKGNKQRTAYIYNGAHAALVDWLNIRGSEPGYIFCAIRKGGAIQSGNTLSGESMRLILDKRIQQAGMNPLTWHDFRRTFAGNLLDESVDLATVQRLMGHSSPITTSNYDRRGEQVRRKAVKTLFVPYEHGNV